MLRKKLAVLLAAVLMMVMAASPVWAGVKGKGNGFYGGDTANQTDTETGNAQKTRTGGGPLNNPHVTGGF